MLASAATGLAAAAELGARQLARGGAAAAAEDRARQRRRPARARGRQGVACSGATSTPSPTCSSTPRCSRRSATSRDARGSRSSRSSSLTLVLGVDFNLERLYRRELGDPRQARPRRRGSRPSSAASTTSSTRRRTGSSSGSSSGASAGSSRHPSSGSPTTTARRCRARELRPLDAARRARRLPRARARRRPTSGSRSAAALSLVPLELRRERLRARSMACRSVDESQTVRHADRSSETTRVSTGATGAGRSTGVSERDFVEDGDNVIELDCATRRAGVARRAPARDRTRGLGALPAAHRGDLRRVRDGCSTRRARATRPSATCARSSTRPPATRASPKLLTAFPAEGNGHRTVDEPDHRGPDRVPEPLRAPRAAVPRLRAHRLHRRRADHRHLEADASRAPVRASLHGAGAPRRADRRRARRARRPAGCCGAPRGVAPLHADARRRGALAHDHDVLARCVRGARAAARVPARSPQPSAASNRGGRRARLRRRAGCWAARSSRRSSCAATRSSSRDRAPTPRARRA